MTATSLDDLYRRPGFLLKRCHQVSAAIFLEECREFGMTPSQYGCLRALDARPGIDQLTLGRLVGLDRSTVGLVVKLLTDRGLIERLVDPRDKRRLRLKVTASGAHLLGAIGPAAIRAQERVLSALPRQSRAPFLQMLETFLRGHGALIDVEAVLAIPPEESPSSRKPVRSRNLQAGKMPPSGRTRGTARLRRG